MKKKPLLLLLPVVIALASCASKKQAPDYDKVDKAYEQYKEREAEQEQ